MAELNFGLLTPPGSQSIGNAFAQGMDQAAVARAQENQNALAQYTLSKAKREDELNTQLLGDLRNATTNDEIYRAYQRAGKGDVASKLRGEQLTQEKTRLEIAGMPATQANTRAETAVRHGTVMKNEATRVLADPTFDNAIRAVVNFGKATGQDVTQELATITAMGNDPVKIAKWAKGHAVTGEQLLNQSKPPDIARLIEYRNSLPEGADRDALTDQIQRARNENFVLNPNTGKFEDRRQGQQPPGAAPASRAFVDPGIAQGQTPLLQASSVDEARRQAIAMDAAGLPVNIRGSNALAAAQPPVNNMPGAQPAAATTTPLNPKQQSDDFQTQRRLEEAGYRRTPQGQEFIPGGKADPTVQAAQTTEKLSARDLQKREAAYPQATTSIKGFDAKAKLFIKDLIALRDDPGLNQITGSLYGRTGSVSREGSRAQALYDKIVAKGGFQALQDLRDASKTGGALGSTSNFEVKSLQASIAALDRRQNAEDVKAALTQLIGDVEGSNTRMRESYDATYAYKTPADSAAPPTAPVDMPSAAAAEIARRAAAAKR